MTREREDIEGAIPEDVQQSFETTLHGQDAAERKVLAIRPDTLFAVVAEGDWIKREYYGYSERNGEHNFGKRVVLELDKGGEVDRETIHWYDEEGKRTQVSLIGNMGGENGSNHWFYRFTLGNLEGVIVWRDLEKKHEFATSTLNKIEIDIVTLHNLYKGRDYSWFPRSPSVVNGQMIYSDPETGVTLEGAYDRDKEVIDLKLKMEDEASEEIKIGRYVDFEALRDEIFPGLLRADPTSTNTELDREWKDNNKVNELLGVTISRPHDIEDASV